MYCIYWSNMALWIALEPLKYLPQSSSLQFCEIPPVTHLPLSPSISTSLLVFHCKIDAPCVFYILWRAQVQILLLHGSDARRLSTGHHWVLFNQTNSLPSPLDDSTTRGFTLIWVADSDRAYWIGLECSRNLASIQSVRVANLSMLRSPGKGRTLPAGMSKIWSSARYSEEESRIQKNEDGTTPWQWQVCPCNGILHRSHEEIGDLTTRLTCTRSARSIKMYDQSNGNVVCIFS